MLYRPFAPFAEPPSGRRTLLPWHGPMARRIAVRNPNALVNPAYDCQTVACARPFLD